MISRAFDVRILADDESGDDDETVRVDNMNSKEEAEQWIKSVYGPDVNIAWISKAAPSYYVISVYMVDRAYGGPEEGGWYYTCGYPVAAAAPLMRVFRDRGKAIDYRHKLQRAIDIMWNRGRYPVSSVLSDGEYEVIIDTNEMPCSFPKERPHYE